MWHSPWRPEASDETNRWSDDVLNNLSSGTGAGEHLARASFVDLELLLLIVCTRSRTCDPFHPEQPTSGKRGGRRGHFARRLHTNRGRDRWPHLGPQEEMGERLNWPSMFLGLQYVWRRYRALVSCVCFWNVCPSNTGINRYSASRCGFVRKCHVRAFLTWAHGSHCSASVLAVSVRWTWGYARYLPQYFGHPAPEIHLLLTPCRVHLLWTAPLRFRRCAVPGCHWGPDEFRPCQRCSYFEPGSPLPWCDSPRSHVL